ncbi:scavenger receptor class A member 3 [Gadus chalcogrammus]|uniref:scavenger receptor class A member 3 n=1 Tax=Gadus chalcogrammus TaxID=1042646 RepID=UPI0024C4D4ED|nr:scavenger receptor class A member 3 [Gadus chalcogrammus]
MKENYGGYENQLFKEEDLTGEEEEMPPFRGRSRGGCVKCQQTHSLQLAVKVLYGIIALLIIAVAILATLAFRKVASLSEEESIYHKKIAKAQQGIDDLGSAPNCSGCLDVAGSNEEINRMKREFEQFQQTLIEQNKIMEQAFQTQTTMKKASSRLTNDMRDHTISVRLLNQSLERYVEQLHGWKDVIEETDDRMKSLTQDQYDLKATMQQVNTTVGHSTLWMDTLQRRADEETLILQKVNTDWQNYSRSLTILKSNTSATTQTVRSIQSGVVATHQKISMSSEMVHDLTLQVMNLQMQLDNVTSFMDEHEENMHDLQYHSRYYKNRTGERFSTLDGRLNSIDMEIDTISSSINATVSHVQSMYKYINIESSSCQSRLRSHSEDLQNLNDTVLLLLDFAETLREQNMMLRVRVFMDVRNLTMVMEEMKLVDTHHTQIIKNITILKGPPGPPGSKGNRGETGLKGLTGRMGLKGDPGPIGGRGGLGEKGSVGPRGGQGEPGPSGLKGVPGLKGIKGTFGLAGIRGDKGAQGDVGIPGKDGLPGLNGPSGIQGEVGLPGIHGIPGPRGTPGYPGTVGIAGTPCAVKELTKRSTRARAESKRH